MTDYERIMKSMQAGIDLAEDNFRWAMRFLVALAASMILNVVLVYMLLR